MKSKLKYLIIILISIISINNVYAKEVEEFSRKEEDRYGVNKKWDIKGKEQYILGTPLVDTKEKIYDYSDILTDDEEEKLKEKARQFVNKTKMDMVIVTPNFRYISDRENEDYAADFYDYNDFGIDFENYSGVLLLRNTYEDDPYFNIYTFGDAQLYFSYYRLENTLDSIYDDIHNGNYYDGFNSFIDQMSSYYESGIPNEMKNYYVDDMGYLKKNYVIPWILIIPLSAIITLIIMLIMIKKNKMVYKATQATEYLNKKTLNITNKQTNLISTHTTSHIISDSSSSGGGGGFHSSGGSSGGGHSSGGGRHG